jgi:hypothetical protein
MDRLRHSAAGCLEMRARTASAEFGFVFVRL